VIMLAAASAGSQLGATATRFVDAARIRFLFGITVLSGGVSVALGQIAGASPRLGFLDVAASVLLLGVSGAMCLVIAVLLFRARRRTTPAVGKARGPQDG
jgi:hypothetical protein